MQLTAIDQINDSYEHVYISPHLDDAALSCGGAIARHTAGAARVLVVTICTQVPPVDALFSPYAKAMHHRWGLAPSDVVTARLHEDVLAMERIGADCYWAGFPDAIYRMPDSYNSDAMLFGQPAKHDPLRQQLVQLLDELHALAPRATFYVPLGVGDHVDHQLVYDATIIGGWGHASAFYEDIPYVCRSGALEARMSKLQRQFVPSIIDIDSTLNRKFGSIACYASQINELFGGEAGMSEQLAAYHEMLRPEVGTYGERVWVMV